MELYEVYNHQTKASQIVDAEQLENMYSELKAGTLEIIDEFDTEE